MSGEQLPAAMQAIQDAHEHLKAGIAALREAFPHRAVPMEFHKAAHALEYALRDGPPECSEGYAPPTREEIARIIAPHASGTVEIHGRAHASRFSVQELDIALGQADAILARFHASGATARGAA